MDPFLPPGHVLSAWWQRSEGLEPRLLVAQRGGDVAEATIRAGEEFLVEVSKNRTCVGEWDGETHRPCAARAAVDGPFGQCASCGDAELEQCVFEPAEGCGHRMCNQPHIVYLAFFGPHAKVGLSRAGREDDRLWEQGADAYAVVANVPTRHEARRIELAVEERLGVPQWHMPRVVLRAWTEPDPVAKAADVLDAYAPGLEEMGLPAPRLEPLGGYPAPAVLEEVPKLRMTHGIHRGVVVGARGKFLFYRPSNGKLTALRWLDLPARWVRVPATLWARAVG